MTDLPTSPNDRQKIKTMIAEITHCFSRMDSEREQIKEIKDELKKTYDLPPKLVNRLARVMYDNNFEDLQAETETFETAYETLISVQSTLKAVK